MTASGIVIAGTHSAELAESAYQARANRNAGERPPIPSAGGREISIDDVNVVHGDTAVVQYGIGTFGSRGTSVGGTAMMMSVGKLQEKMKKIASTMMEVPPDQLTFSQRTIAMASDAK